MLMISIQSPFEVRSRNAKTKEVSQMTVYAGTFCGKLSG